MSEPKKPDTHAAAVKAAEDSKRNNQTNDTRNWNYNERETYKKNGGK